MSTMRFVCGSCDYSTGLTEKLKSHYMAIHQLSVGDASVMVRSNVGELMESQEFYERFEHYIEHNSQLHGVERAWALDAAKHAAGLEGAK